MRRSLLAVFGAVALATSPVAAQTPEQRSSGHHSDPAAVSSHKAESHHAAVEGARIRHVMRDKVNAGLDTDHPIRKALNESATPHEVAALSPPERDALFTEFTAYRKRLSDTPKSAGLLDPRQREALFMEFAAYQKRQAESQSSVRQRDVRQQEAQYAATAN